MASLNYRNNSLPIENELVAVFPIENNVFFPHTLIPLHIFEPRYRRMINDVIQGDYNKFVLTGFSDHQPMSLGVLVEIVQYEELEDNRSNLLIQTLERVKIEDYFRPYSPDDYAIAEIQIIPEVKIVENKWLELRSKLYREFKIYIEALTGRKFNIPEDKLEILLTPEESINSACYYTNFSVDLKKKLLKQDTMESRGDLLLSILSQLNQTSN